MILALFAILLASIGPQHVWKEDEGCAYSPTGIGRNLGLPGRDDYVTDIREVVDNHGLTIGWLYNGSTGRYAIQGNPLMSAFDLRRFHLEHDEEFWTTARYIDPKDIPYRVIACRREHLIRSPISNVARNAAAARAYGLGEDHVPDSNVDLYPERSRYKFRSSITIGKMFA